MKQMINFQFLEANKEKLRMDYLLAKPFPYLVIDNFCEPQKIEDLYNSIPELHNKSRDYMFANNKFEKSNYREIGPEFNELYTELSSTRINEFLSFIANEEIFVDPDNHGGGLHQGKQNSFLDMHLDLNYHPLKKGWYRNMNLLLYLNKDWKPEFGGQLKLLDRRSGESDELEVPFNRMIIQQTRAYTLHGYDQTHFPPGKYRTSIATYAYSYHHAIIEKPRTTDWFARKDQPVKRIISSVYGPAVKVKNLIFGSGTAKNK